MFKKFRIFLSCGQHELEKEDGLKIKSFLETEFNDKVEIFFAEKEYTSEGLTNIIYKNLAEYDAFIGIFHARDKIISPDERTPKYRSSLFVCQELAIASFLRKKYFITYRNPHAIVEGINKYLMNRDKIFDNIDDIISDLKEVVREWLEIWTPSSTIIDVKEPLLRLSDGQMLERGAHAIDIIFAFENTNFEKVEDLTFGLILPNRISLRDSRFFSDMRRLYPNNKLYEILSTKETFISLYEIQMNILPLYVQERILPIDWNPELNLKKMQLIFFLLHKSFGYRYFVIEIIKTSPVLFESKFREINDKEQLFADFE